MIDITKLYFLFVFSCLLLLFYICLTVADAHNYLIFKQYEAPYLIKCLVSISPNPLYDLYMPLFNELSPY